MSLLRKVSFISIFPEGEMNVSRLCCGSHCDTRVTNNSTVSNTIRMIKSKIKGWVEHVTRLGEEERCLQDFGMEI